MSAKHYTKWKDSANYIMATTRHYYIHNHKDLFIRDKHTTASHTEVFQTRHTLWYTLMFTPLKLCLATAIHNFKGVKITALQTEAGNIINLHNGMLPNIVIAPVLLSQINNMNTCRLCFSLVYHWNTTLYQHLIEANRIELMSIGSCMPSL